MYTSAAEKAYTSARNRLPVRWQTATASTRVAVSSSTAAAQSIIA